MMSPFLNLLVDVIVAGLLVAVILYCRKLNNSIAQLRDSKSEMAKLFAEFDGSIKTAQETVTELKDATRRAENLMHERTEKATALADDLAFLIERGNKIAEQLEQGGRPRGNSAASPEPVAQPSKRAATASKADERDLEEHAKGGLSALLNQLSGKEPARPRSKAEQELFESFKPNRS